MNVRVRMCVGGGFWGEWGRGEREREREGVEEGRAKLAGPRMRRTYSEAKSSPLNNGVFSILNAAGSPRGSCHNAM
jgi:hypothetical protein